MGKWKIIGISLAVLVTAGVVFVNSPWLITAAFYFLQPSESFADTVPPAAPDYSDTAYWASLPSMEDAADFLPAELSSNQSAKHDVAVFFVHPTTYLSNDTWNQPLDHETTNQRTDAGFDAAILVYGDAAQIRFVGRMRSVSRPSQWVHADIVRLPEDLTGTLTGAGSHCVPRDLAARLGCVLACWQAVTGVYGKTDGVCRDQSIF